MPVTLLNKIMRIVGALLAVIIGLYPVLYFVRGHHFRLLATKDVQLLSNVLWNAGFYTHIAFAGIALIIGWAQFNNRLRLRKPQVHRLIGKIYIITAILSGCAGTAIAAKATGGLIPAAGFFCLGVIWVYTTIKGFLLIREGNIAAHRRLMIYSYACCFAAVTLRLWLTGLRIWLPFGVAYPIVAWLSWVPNLAVAGLIVRKKPAIAVL